jgi:hypothetical protein
VEIVANAAEHALSGDVVRVQKSRRGYTAILRLDGTNKHVSLKLRPGAPMVRGKRVLVTDAVRLGDSSYAQGTYDSVENSTWFEGYEARVRALAREVAGKQALLRARPRVVHVLGATGDPARSDVEAHLDRGEFWPVRLSETKQFVDLLLDLVSDPNIHQDVVLLARGGGANVFQIEHESIAEALALLATRVPVLMGLGHHIDHFLIESLLHKEYVGGTPGDVASLLVRYERDVGTTEVVAASTAAPISSLPVGPPDLVVEAGPANLVFATVVQPVIERIVHAPVPVPRPSLRDRVRRSVRRVLVALGVLSLLTLVGQMVMERWVSFRPTREVSSGERAPEHSDQLATKAATIVTPSGSSNRSIAPATAARKQSRATRRARAPRTGLSSAERLSEQRPPEGLVQTELPQAAPETGRVVHPAPPPTVRVPQSPLLRGR